MTIDLLLPWPISTNSLWRAVGRRNIISKNYRQWLDDANHAVAAQEPVPTIVGKVNVLITLHPPTKRAFDPDNFVKCVLDFIVARQFIEGDSNLFINKLEIVPFACGSTASGAWVHIERAG